MLREFWTWRVSDTWYAYAVHQVLVVVPLISIVYSMMTNRTSFTWFFWLVHHSHCDNCHSPAHTYHRLHRHEKPRRNVSRWETFSYSTCLFIGKQSGESCSNLLSLLNIVVSCKRELMVRQLLILHFYVISILLVCFAVQEKEKLRGRDPLAPDDAPFGEYTAGYSKFIWSVLIWSICYWLYCKLSFLVDHFW